MLHTAKAIGHALTATEDLIEDYAGPLAGNVSAALWHLSEDTEILSDQAFQEAEFESFQSPFAPSHNLIGCGYDGHHNHAMLGTL